MNVFINILTGLICFLAGFYYGVWYIKQKYLDLSQKLLLTLESDDYNLDFVTGAGVTLNTLSANKLDSNVKLLITRKLIAKRKRERENEKQ